MFYLFLGLFIILLLLSQLLSRKLSRVLFITFRNEKIAIVSIALLFFPGVVIHELSHFFAASLLFVPTGEIEFVPTIQGNTVKLGSVAVARTDIFRRFLIGVAPLLGGLSLMGAIFWFLSPIPLQLHWKTALFVFVLFEIGNTMFASKKDTEGAIGLGVIALLLLGFAIFIKVPVIAFLQQLGQAAFITTLSMQASFLLGIVIFCDLLIVGGLLLMERLLLKRHY